jgi:hypothetical protein
MCLLFAAFLLQAVAEMNEKLKQGLFRLTGKKVETTIEPATDYYLAEVGGRCWCVCVWWLRCVRA